jgi:hypothetical protein
MPCSDRLRAGARLMLLATLAFAARAIACPILTPQEAAPAASAQSTSAAGPRPVWDWFANASLSGPRLDQASIVLAVDRQRLGHGSWICSPSGTGMRSSASRGRPVPGD